MTVSQLVLKRIAKTVIVVVAASALMVVSTTTARAAAPIETYKNVYTRRCLDDSNRGLRTVNCASNNQHQQWFVLSSGGLRVFVNRYTGLCLTYGSGEGGFVTTIPCGEDIVDHYWYVLYYREAITFANTQGGGCLDDSNRGLRILACDPLNEHQEWI